MKQNDYVSHLSTRNKKSKKNKLNVKNLMECTRMVYIWGAYNKLHLAEGMLELKLHLIKFIMFMVVYQEIYSTKILNVWYFLYFT